MPYTPRPTTSVCCAYCALVFAARHARRRYCSKSCNVRASYARTGRRLPGTGGFAPAAPLARALAAPVAVVRARPQPAMTYGDELRRLCHLLQQARARAVVEQRQIAQVFANN